MMHKTGECPVCKQNINPGEDAVVCPDCGTPYHRACWQKNGACVHESKHGTGYEYQPPEPEIKNPPPGATGGEYEGPAVACVNCGARNPSRNIFCDSCGSPLHGQAPQGQNSEGETGGPFAGFGGMPFGGAGGQPGPVFMHPGMDLSGEIDEIPKRDWNVFIGSSQATYLARMAQQQMRGTKTSFMFSAFFLPHYFFAYRKMWGLSAIATLIRLICYLPTVGVIILQSGYNVLGFSEAQLYTLGNFTYVLWLVVGLLSSLFALWLYRQSAGKKIKALRGQHTDEGNYQEALQKAGGVSVLGVVLVAVAVLAFFMVTSQFVSPEVLSAYLNYMMTY